MRRRTDDGMTVVEVAITSMIMLAVFGMLMGLVVSLTNNEARTQALVTNEQNVRFVLADFARDVRAANPLSIFASGSEYRNQIEMEIGPLDERSVVRWRYITDPSSPAYRTVVREVVSGPNAGTSVTRLRRVRNTDRGIDFLQYYDAHAQDDGDEMIDNGIGAAQIANCTIRVRMTITADSEPGPEPFTESLDVHLRNRLPGGIGC